jgi:hypothetical protein
MNGAIGATDSLLQKAVTYILDPLYRISVVVAFLYFIFGVTYLLFQMNSPDKREQARSHLMYGILGLFIILSVGAIIKFINSLVGGGLVY